MQFEWLMAIRYLFTRKSNAALGRISFISIITVMLSVAIPVLVLSVMNGFHNSIGEKLLSTNFHLRLIPRGAGFSDYRQYCDILNQYEEVEWSIPYYEAQGMLKSRSYDARIVIRAVDPEDIAQSPMFLEHNVIQLSRGFPGHPPEYKPFDPRVIENPNHIAVGEALANELHISKYQPVELVIPEGIESGSPNLISIPLEVSALFSAGYAPFDTTMTYINLEAARNIFDIGDIVTGIGIYVKEDDDAITVATRIKNREEFDGFILENTQMEGIFRDFNREKDLMFIVLVIMILAAFLTIYITLNVVVIQKTREVAILKSFGTKNNAIQRIFIIQGLIIGVVGGVLGLILGTLLTISLLDIISIAEYIFEFEMMPADVFYMTELPYEFQIGDMLFQFSGAIFVSLLASYFPAKRASVKRPVEIIRLN